MSLNNCTDSSAAMYKHAVVHTDLERQSNTIEVAKHYELASSKTVQAATSNVFVGLISRLVGISNLVYNLVGLVIDYIID